MKARVKLRMQQAEMRSLARQGKRRHPRPLRRKMSPMLTVPAQIGQSYHLHFSRGWPVKKIAEFLNRPEKLVEIWLRIDLENLDLHV